MCFAIIARYLGRTKVIFEGGTVSITSTVLSMKITIRLFQLSTLVRLIEQ